MGNPYYAASASFVDGRRLYKEYAEAEVETVRTDCAEAFTSPGLIYYRVDKVGDLDNSYGNAFEQD